MQNDKRLVLENGQNNLKRKYYEKANTHYC